MSTTSTTSIPLSPRQEQVVSRLVQGMNLRDIACELGVGYQAVKSYLRQSANKMGIDGRRCGIKVANEARQTDAPFKCPPSIRLTSRELESLAMLAQGHTNKEIAESQGVVEGTVKNIFRLVYDKIGMDTRQEAAAWYWAHCE